VQDVEDVIKGLQSITGKCSCSNTALQAVFNCSVPVRHNAGVSKLTVQLAIKFASVGGGKTKHKPCAKTCILHFAHSHMIVSALSLNTPLKGFLHLASFWLLALEHALLQAPSLGCCCA